jgi:hypothetical protein
MFTTQLFSPAAPSPQQMYQDAMQYRATIIEALFKLRTIAQSTTLSPQEQISLTAELNMAQGMLLVLEEKIISLIREHPNLLVPASLSERPVTGDHVASPFVFNGNLGLDFHPGVNTTSSSSRPTKGGNSTQRPSIKRG